MSTTGDILIRGGTVLTMDREASVLRDTDVLVQNGTIARIGKSIAVERGTTTLEATGHLVMPGLIQGHLHLGQTVFRGMAENRRLLAWLRERIWPLEAAHNDESAYWSARLGAAECLLGGTTTIQDIGLGPGAKGLLSGIVDSGLRARAGMCLMDEGDGLPVALAGDTENELRATEELGSWFEAQAPDRLSYGLNPRFILSCSDDLWQGIAELAQCRGWPVHTHALEQEEEGEAVRALKGRDEVEYFDQCGILDANFCMAHGVWMTGEHRSRCKGKPVSVVHCPSSNLKLGSGIADLVALREDGIPVGVGADGAPCNNDLDGFEEVRLAAMLQSVRHGPGTFSGLDALRLATSEGARALGWEDRIGSLEEGKRADVLILGTDRPEFLAHETVDAHDLVVFSGSGAAVRHVFVGGRQMVADGALVGQDVADIRAQAGRSLSDVVRRAGLSD